MDLRRELKPAVLVTVSRISGSAPRASGAKMIVLADGTIHGTIGGGQVEQQAIRDALDCLEEGAGGAFRYPLTVTSGQCCGGTMELLMEVLNVNPQLYIYGAGHVGQALCRVLDNTAFVPHLIDPRPAWIGRVAPGARVVPHAMEWRAFNHDAAWNTDRVYAAVMTPDHAEDYEIVADLLQRPLRFLGLIGSHAKWAQFQQSLTSAGFTREQIDSVHCPIGVGHTGKGPEEIAISVAAEILKDHYAGR